MTARCRYTDLDLHELRIQLAPEYYTVVAFRGAAIYKRDQAASFQEALTRARELITDRPAMIYAVRGQNHSHIINVHRHQEIRMAYLITWNGYLKDLQISTYASRLMANIALSTDSTPGAAGLVVEGELDIVGSNQLLADMYNMLHTQDDPGVVQRFSSKSEGQRRLFARIESRAKGQPVLSAKVAPTEVAAGASPTEESDVAKAKKTYKKAKTPKVAGSARSKIDKTKTIKVVAEKNPLRAGSAVYDRWDKGVKDGKTVQWALDHGVWMADLRWDIKQGYIKLV
jgi:hypothetical protein